MTLGNRLVVEFVLQVAATRILAMGEEREGSQFNLRSALPLTELITNHRHEVLSQALYP
jgi:hypothetical protein